MTTFDRYLFSRFIHVFLIGFVATFGLFMVIDGFTNVDSFQQGADDQSALTILSMMAGFYFYQSFVFFNLVGPILTVIGVMVVFTLVLRNSELHPILSAGVPTYRLVVPLLMGAAVINLLLIANQELVIPEIAHTLHSSRDKDVNTAHQLEPVYDFATHILIAGKEVFIGEKKIGKAEFVLPVPAIALDLTTLKAEKAYFKEGKGDQPSGWLLKNVQPSFAEIHLTDEGRKVVRAVGDPNDTFVVSDVNFDQLTNRHMSSSFISTTELISRIKNPAYSWISVRGLKLNFHERLTKPILNLIAVLLAVPFVVRKEHSSLVANIAISTGVLGLLFVINQASLYMGKANIVTPELAAWGPIILSGSSCAWFSEIIQT